MRLFAAIVLWCLFSALVIVPIAFAIRAYKEVKNELDKVSRREKESGRSDGSEPKAGENDNVQTS